MKQQLASIKDFKYHFHQLAEVTGVRYIIINPLQFANNA